MAYTELTPASPFYIHPSESITQALVQPVLAGANYSTWSRSMKIALIMKKKIGFVLGTIPRPAVNDNRRELWDQCDMFVFSWLLNSVNTSIAQSIIHAQTSHQAWNDLEERFSTGDVFRYSDLIEEICILKQGSSTVQEYFTTLKILWEDMLTVRPLPSCTCNPQPSCTCGLSKKITANNEFDHVIRFLKGLNDGYSNMKNQVLCMSPFPSLNQVFGMALNAEKQLMYETGNTPQAMASKTIHHQSRNANQNFMQGGRNMGYKRFGNSNGKQKLQCSYCGFSGHTVERCYKKHGYPTGFKGKSVANQTSAIQIHQNNGDGEVTIDKINDECFTNAEVNVQGGQSTGMHMLNEEQYKAVLQLLSQSSDTGNLFQQPTAMTVHSNTSSHLGQSSNFSGSFSRTAVNFSAGCETVVSNIVMAVTVILSLEFLTRLLYFTPVAILASIILSALPGLIDLSGIFSIWKLDKLDFLACIGAFFGVLFATVEIGLLVAVGISFVKVVLLAIQPGTEILGQIPGTDIFVNVDQYPVAVQIPGVLVTRIKSALFCFANANFIAEGIIEVATKKQEVDAKENAEGRIQLAVFNMSNLMNIDTTGLSSLEELHRKLALEGIEFAVINPRWQVIKNLS